MLCPHTKNRFSLYFRKIITRFSVGLLMICQVLSVSCKLCVSGSIQIAVSWKTLLRWPYYRSQKKKYKNGNAVRTVLLRRRMPEADKFEAGASQTLQALTTTTRSMTPLFSDMMPSHWAISYRRLEGTQSLCLQRARGPRRQSGSFETSEVVCLRTLCHTLYGRLTPWSLVALCKNHIWNFPIL